MEQRKLFGTDGIRGVANRGSMTPEVAFRIGAAMTSLGRRAKHPPRIVVGKDTRLSGYMFETSIAAGICDGLRLGHNARAAMITRGLAEISRLGARLGGRTETFMGLAGAGDLILTCTGDLSRNRTVGLRLAAGESLATILHNLGHVAEGVSTAHEVARLAAAQGVEMPITRAVCAAVASSSGMTEPGA